MPLNRTYQGRVTSAHHVEGKQLARTESLSRADWEKLLSEHLHIYQDAINYYLVCFAACARGSTVEALANLEHRIREAWETHDYRKAGKHSGFLGSLHRRFPNLFLSDTTFDQAADLIIGDNVSQDVLNLAVEALLTDLGGEGSIQQGGRSYLPYFCRPNTNANFPRSPRLLERDRAKESLPAILYGSPRMQDIRNTFELHHFATEMKGQDEFTGEELKKRLEKWLQHLVDEQLVSPVQHETWNKEITDLDESTISLPRYNGASAKGTEKTRLYAFLLLKLLPPSKERLEVLRSAFPEPKTSTRTKRPSQKQIDAAEVKKRLTSKNRDPIELARGPRKFVFRSFTSLFMNNSPSDGPTWVEFDISAFKEALKTLNQIEQKTEERLENLSKTESHIQYFESKKGSPRNADEPVTFHKDLRLQLVKKLKQRLADNLDEDFQEGGYRLRKATIKGWRALRERYEKALANNPSITRDELIDKAFVPFQQRTKNLGSALLFRLLAEPEFRPIWEGVPEESLSDWAKHQWSHDLLTDSVEFDLLCEDVQDLKENLHIKLTPAHFQYSRRPVMLSDLGGTSKVIHRASEDGQASIITSLYRKNSETGIPEEGRFELTYSAPRLIRDQISGTENRSLHQPLLQGLGISVPEDLKSVAKKAKDLPIALMPDWHASSVRRRSSKPDRFLLNFPATLETEWIAKRLEVQELWKGQFNGTTDEHLHLHWPGTIKKEGDSEWWKQKEIQKNGFTVAAYDLGIRTAAAYAIYHIVSSLAQVPKNKNKFARSIGTAAGLDWHAYPIRRGTVRLPGEDQNELRPLSKQDPTLQRTRELYGKRGRPASVEETREFIAAIEPLAPYLAEWLCKEVEIYKTNSSTPYLQEQNRLLLRAAGQLQGHLRSAHRLMIDLKSDGEDPELKGLDPRLAVYLRDHPNSPLDPLASHVRTLRSQLRHLLERSANRILPLRKFEWQIQEQLAVKITGIDQQDHEFIPHELVQVNRSDSDARVRVRGHGGISIKRIELIEDLRKRLLSYQREVNRGVGEPMSIGFGRHSGSIPDAAPTLLKKLDRLKDQRVKQTAHLILANALNLRLRDQKTPKSDRANHVHGEYETCPPLPSGRLTCDFIVIEDLNRYLTQQERSRSENSQLMRWAHRAITDTLCQLSEPYGLPVVTAAASFSSKFCSTTGRPGFRAVEITPRNHGPLEQWLREKQSSQKYKVASQISRLFAEHKDNKKLKLILPMNGGIMFVPAIDPYSENRSLFPATQADLNAAQNLVLRAIAAPERLDVFHKIRATAKNNRITLRCENAREKSALDPKAVVTSALPGSELSKEVRGKKFSNFFYLGKNDTPSVRTGLDQATCALPDGTVLQLASSFGLWSTMKSLEVSNMIDINNRRLRDLGLPSLTPEADTSEPLHDPDDDIPMNH